MARRNVVSVDFKDVKDRVGGVRVKPGDYAVKVESVELKTSDSSGNDYLNWKLKGLSGELKNETLYFVTSLQENALFNLRNTLLACKLPVPRSKYALDLDKLPGKVFGVTVDDDEYKGRVKSVVVATWPLQIKNGKIIKQELPQGEEFDEDDEEFEEDDADEDTDTVEDDDELDDDVEEDEDEDEEEPPAAKPKAKPKGTHKRSRK